MVVKYNGVWNVHVTSSKIDALKDFYKRIEKKSTRATKFADKMIKRIDEATYWPMFVTFRDTDGNITHDEGDDEVRRKIEESKASLFDDLMIAGKIAFEDGVLSTTEFMDLEGLLYESKDGF